MVLRNTIFISGLFVAALIVFAGSASGQGGTPPRPPVNPDVEPMILRKPTKPQPKPVPKVGLPAPAPASDDDSITSDDFGNEGKAANGAQSGFRKVKPTSCGRACIRARSSCEARAGKGPGRTQRLRACRARYRTCAARCG